GLEVVAVAAVVVAVTDATVVAGRGIEVATGTGGVGCAAVAVLVQVETVFAVRGKATHFTGGVDHAVDHREHQQTGHLVAFGRSQRRAGGLRRLIDDRGGFRHRIGRHDRVRGGIVVGLRTRDAGQE